MATAVLHPQDYLAGPQNDRSRQFFCVSEYPSPTSRSGGRGFSSTHEPSIPPTTGRDAAEGSASPNRGCGLLRRRSSSEGLLPLPDRVLQNAHNTYSRLAPKISVCSLGENAITYGNKHFTSSHHPNFSSYASEMFISRRASMPMLDHAARAQSFFSECFPLHGVQLPERRPLRHNARYIFDSAQGKCMNASSSCADRNVISCQKLKFVANSQFSERVNPVHLKWADSNDQSIHYRKRMHSEFCQAEVYLRRQCGKPPLKVLPDAQAKSICTKMNTVGRKLGVNKHLKRSASEKLQERSEPCIVRRSGTKEVTRKLMTRLSEGVEGSLPRACSHSKVEVKLTSPASEGISGSCSSVLDNGEMWVSMMNDEKWAGPSFINSPSPSALPVPSFTFLFSRTGIESAKTADFGADMVSGKPSLDSKHWRDVTSATNDLRRMLHLDHTSCDL